MTLLQNKITHGQAMVTNRLIAAQQVGNHPADPGAARHGRPQLI